MFICDLFKTDVVDVRVSMFVFHFFESQENFGVGVRELLFCLLVVFLPGVLLNMPGGLNFINSSRE